jgi:hypothetical protein
MPDFRETTFICGSLVMRAPTLLVYLVGGAAGAVTLGCIVATLKMLVRPGETELDHPKRRILAADR